MQIGSAMYLCRWDAVCLFDEWGALRNSSNVKISKLPNYNYLKIYLRRTNSKSVRHY